MFGADGTARAHCHALFEELQAASREDLGLRQIEADKAFLTQGITFTVYGDEQGTERIFPFDLLPRIITAAEWRTIVSGLTQRLTAINLFLKDVYHEGRILAEGIVPGICFTAAATFAARCAACTSTATSTSRSPAAISCGSRTAGSSCSRTTSACRAVCPTCSRTARSPSEFFRDCSTGTRSARSRSTGRRCSRRCAPWRRRTSPIRPSWC